MIKSYFTISLRKLWKHKFFTFINITGLSIGISAALVIYIIVSYDLSFDKFHNDPGKIYRVVTDYSFMGEVVAHSSGVNGPLAATIKSEVAGVKIAAPFFTLDETNVYIPNGTDVPVKFRKEGNMVLADGRYFNLFSYKWLAGSAQSALEEPYQVVLTSDQAKIYFPGISYHQMLGKTILYDTIKTTVTGIVQTPSQNTDLYFHGFISYSTCLSNISLRGRVRPTEWPGTPPQSSLFIKLADNVTPDNVENQINMLLKKNNPIGRPGGGQKDHLQPLNDLHFNELYPNFEKGRTANKATLYGLLVVAGFLLLLGCINFINLSTAQASQSAKEIGIRKTMGSTRVQLIIQFLSETFIVTLFAVIIAILIASVALKLFADFIPPGLKINYISRGDLLLFLIILTFVVTLLSGFYPALILSGYKPISVMKNLPNTVTGISNNALLRKFLTVTQFVIAQFFIMATLLVNKQVFYVLHKDLGFRKDAVINISTPAKSINTNLQQVFKNKISNIPQIEMISIGSEAPSSDKISSFEVNYKDGKKEVKTTLQQRFGDENYIKVYNIKLLAGRNLRPSDSATAVLINANYANAIGFKNPANAIGKSFDYEGDKREIVGVVADFHQKSLHTPIVPISIQAPHYKFNDRTFHILLKPQNAGNNDWNKAISSMKKTWKEVYPDDDFDYHFFDEDIARFYDSEQRTSKLLVLATGLSLFISCLGLLGLAIYNTNQRTKEIGIRKVLGASVTEIVKLLSTEVIWLIVLSFVLVSPMAWYAMNRWMQNFAERTTISWWIFLLGGASMLITALITSSFQTIKAAISNPTKSLRSE
jgi:ABC-type antimicrobial peptide transport system permease subunit